MFLLRVSPLSCAGDNPLVLLCQLLYVAEASEDRQSTLDGNRDGNRGELWRTVANVGGRWTNDVYTG